MSTPSDAIDAAVQRILAEAPPLPAEVEAIVARTFRKPPEASSPASDAA